MDRRQLVERWSLWSGGQYFDLRSDRGAVLLSLQSSCSPAGFTVDGPACRERSMRGYAVIAVLIFAPGLWPAGNQLTWEDRVELTRGLTAEYATVKVLLPRSSKPLVFDAINGYDKNQWMEVGRQSGPAARTGDLVQVTKI